MPHMPHVYAACIGRMYRPHVCVGRVELQSEQAGRSAMALLAAGPAQAHHLHQLLRVASHVGDICCKQDYQSCQCCAYTNCGSHACWSDLVVSSRRGGQRLVARHATRQQHTRRTSQYFNACSAFCLPWLAGSRKVFQRAAFRWSDTSSYKTGRSLPDQMAE